jgi:ABC-2 type transport system permease protein
MRVDRIVTIARREYLAGVRGRAFWITTVLLPLMMVAMLVLPSFLLAKTRATLRLAVVDVTGRVGQRLVDDLGGGRTPPAAPKSTPAGGPDTAAAPGGAAAVARFAAELRDVPADPETARAALDADVLAGRIDAWIWIDSSVLAGGNVPYHAESVSNFVTQRVLESALTRAVSAARLSDAGIDSAEVAKLTRAVDLDTVRVSEAGARKEASMAGFALAYFLFFLLYIVTLLYGQQVMNGVLEEKTSRIVEVVLSTARPVELMAGKLFGIASVGLTQLAIWFVVIVGLTAPGVAASLVTLPEGVTIPTVSLGIVAHFFALFLLGFLLFASLYAAVGAASNDLREAQQLASMIVLFIVLPVFLMFSVINDPDSTTAVIFSLIPPFTPLLMLLRIVVKTPPAWQIALGYTLTAGFVAALLWGCGRIYRIGILMHGKRPTLRELARWLRYS